MADEELLKQLLKQVEDLTEEVRALKAQMNANAVPDWTPDTWNPKLAHIPEACRHCSNHPCNGGDGICNCTLGLMTVTC